MKYLSALLFSIILFSCNNKVSEKKAETTNSTDRVEVIDFYGTHRCITCKAIESNAKYTVNTYFKKEQQNGTVVFKAINVDDKANYTIAEKFEATGTALFLNIIKNGKETHIDLTDFGFSNGREQESFSKQLKAKVEEALKQL